MEEIIASKTPDRCGRIRAMGVVQLVLGGLCGLLLLIALAGVFIGRAVDAGMGKETQVGLGSSLASLGIYALAAAFFFAVGIGSLRMRRWVRPVVLAFMWPSLIFGAAGFAFALFFLPAVFGAMPLPGGPNPELQQAVLSAMAVVIDVFLFIAFVAIPALHLMIYQPKAIRETLARHDTSKRFTDDCPTQVFGVAVSLMSIGLMQLFSIVMGVAVFFGTILTGPAASVLIAIEALICFALARFTFQRRLIGFWGSLAFLVYLSARNGIGFLFVDYADIIRATGAVDEMSAEMMETAFSTIPTGPIFALFWAIAGITAAAYVAYTKKYFAKEP